MNPLSSSYGLRNLEMRVSICCTQTNPYTITYTILYPYTSMLKGLIWGVLSIGRKESNCNSQATTSILEYFYSWRQHLRGSEVYYLQKEKERAITITKDVLRSLRSVLCLVPSKWTSQCRPSQGALAKVFPAQEPDRTWFAKGKPSRGTPAKVPPAPGQGGRGGGAIEQNFKQVEESSFSSLLHCILLYHILWRSVHTCIECTNM